MKEQNDPIDIVIPWVDGSDPIWRAERDRYYKNEPVKGNKDNSEARYRDWGTLRYIFRGIEKHMPWIRKIHLITYGHLPEWLNLDAHKLHIVNHRDYIPEQYLPTFSSHTIELNIHRISGLSDQFLLFNDDTFPTRDLQKVDFFQNGQPKDFAIETVLIGKYHRSIAGVSLSNAEIINQNYAKRDVINKNWNKWFHYRYGIKQLQTLLLLPWQKFSDFSNNHSINPYLKSTFKEVWEKEFEVLDETCRHRFRSMNDVNQWLMRDWQLVNGTFCPKSPGKEKTFTITNDLSTIRKAFTEGKYQVVCINDVSYEKLEDERTVMHKIIEILDTAYPKPSEFEQKING